MSHTTTADWEKKLAAVILKAQKDHRAVVPNVLIAVRKIVESQAIELLDEVENFVGEDEPNLYSGSFERAECDAENEFRRVMKIKLSQLRTKYRKGL